MRILIYMTRRIVSVFLSFLLLAQGTAALWAQQSSVKSFYEKAGWLDHRSNTLRRVAERGERGAYNSYKNNNPSPRNAYESVNIHQANLTDLSLYRNSEIYRRAKQIRDAFLPERDAVSSQASAQATEEDLTEIRLALAELMDLHAQYGAYNPMVTQSVLEVSRAVLAVQKQYRLFAGDDLYALKKLYERILSRPALCGQGEGYRIFCEGRADALDGFSFLARTERDARLLAEVLKEDIRSPYAARELLAGTAALLELGREELLGSVLEEAVGGEGETFWQKIDVFMTGWWIGKVQFRNGRYQGNVSSAAILPGAYGQADGNAWEELARLLSNGGRPSPAAAALLARYGLGSCKADLNDWDDGKPLQAGKTAVFVSVRCRTLLPFLAGALACGVQNGADEKLQEAARRLQLSPAALVARLYFESVMGDLNAETELRLDNLLYDVFEKDVKAAEERRRRALAGNRDLDRQIETLRKELDDILRFPQQYFLPAEGEVLPRGWRLQGEIAALEKQKTPVPSLPDTALRRYGRDSDTYRRKETGQRIYASVNEVSSAIDMGLGIYYTLALPAAAVKGLQWGLSLRRGLAAVRAGKITADARRLAALSGRLKNIRSARFSSAAALARERLTKMLAQQRPPSGVKAAVPSVSADVPGHKTAVVRPAVIAAAEPPAQVIAAGSRLTLELPSVPAFQVPVSAAGMRFPPGLPAPGGTVPAVPTRPAPPSRISADVLRKARLGAYAVTPDAAHMYGAALAVSEKMRFLENGWEGVGIAALKQDPARMGRAVRATGEYARLEKDLEFYRSLSAARPLEINSAARLSRENGLLSHTRRAVLVREYVGLLRAKLANWGKEPSVLKASLSKELDTALKISDELAGPAATVWTETGRISAPALRKRLTDGLASGTLSPIQRRETAELLVQLRLHDPLPNELALLQLRTLNIPFLQKSPNTLWIWGDGLSEADMLVRKTPLGFPMNRVFRGAEFPQIAPFLQKGKENVLLFNGHGYVSQNGFWKGILRQSRPGETRPAATFSAEKVLTAVRESQSPLTSVYVHSCQSGSLFKDLKVLFEKNPDMAHKTEWFASFAPMQPASSRPLPAQASYGSVRQRLLDKLLLNMTDNGAGLGARAWVKGRELYPLRASVQKLEREIASAPAAEKAALRQLRDDLQMLLDISDATDHHELMNALDVFRYRHPNNIQYWDRVAYADAFMTEGALEFAWGLEPWAADAVVNMAPFIRLEPQWVNYVTGTAREMFALFKDAPKKPALSEAGLLVRAAGQTRKDLENAPVLLEQMKRLQKENAAGWEETLLSNASVRDLSSSVEQGRRAMQALQDKWRARGVVSGEELYGDFAQMRSALQDLSQYARLEKQTNAAEELYRMYNLQAGLTAWPLPSAPENPLKLFRPYQRNRLAQEYISALRRRSRTQPAPLRTATGREIARAVAWSDDFALEGSLLWSEEVLPSAPALRRRLAELGRDKKDFTPLQAREYRSLARILYSGEITGGDRLLELQNRILFLPKARQTSNAVFLWGDELLPSQVWERKTPLGFFRPKFIQFAPVSKALSFFKPGEENVLLAHVHGGISRRGVWKGILIDGEPHPNLTFGAREMLQALPRTRSAHNSVYVNGCFSGTLLNDVIKLKKEFPQAAAKTDWFVTAAPLQYTAPETLPAQFVTGTAREKLFGKMLQRITYNGDGLGGRALVGGKELYPLSRAVRNARRRVKTASVSQRAEAVRLYEEMSLLKAIADARTEKDLLNALRRLESARPGTVKNLGAWREDSPFLLQKRKLLPERMAGPDGFAWGVDYSKGGLQSTEPYIVLKQEWVNETAAAARELFRAASSEAR